MQHIPSTLTTPTTLLCHFLSCVWTGLFAWGPELFKGSYTLGFSQEDCWHILLSQLQGSFSSALILCCFIRTKEETKIHSIWPWRGINNFFSSGKRPNNVLEVPSCYWCIKQNTAIFSHCPPACSCQIKKDRHLIFVFFFLLFNVIAILFDRRTAL